MDRSRFTIGNSATSLTVADRETFTQLNTKHKKEIAIGNSTSRHCNSTKFMQSFYQDLY